MGGLVLKHPIAGTDGGTCNVWPFGRSHSSSSHSGGCVFNVRCGGAGSFGGDVSGACDAMTIGGGCGGDEKDVCCDVVMPVSDGDVAGVVGVGVVPGGC